ncbi:MULTISPECIES: glycoside hydrolase family 2 TIM barrel-domain containing protein [unclassified Rhizobium]|uniref:glycoside hydrolase family 2 protein n=1 Tax=unclassified Rhizobium TaxID=2613769 RepID=UPI000BE99C14|nr:MULTISPECIES: glycoside hydrolase family 2 TIM barrel-domain containing protein [unclassified Rhizobium]MDF0663619.1 glycoside hydrolase family 2 TIM barrel-domain containing protein [Rhizobium sp. BC49]PDS79850.1 glycoside hydrolase family 2 [Rhizobium sp. L18]
MTTHSQSPAPAATPLRATLSLDGAWEFRHETDQAWRQAKVPAHWQACFEDLAVSFGSATYRRSFSLPSEWTGGEIAICFGAVSDLAIVSINGTELGRHEGGYLPFEFTIPADLLKADNTIEVLASLPDAHRNENGTDFAEIPHGKQSWYGPQGGIWQSVRLEAREPAHISSLRLDPIWPEGRLEFEAELTGLTESRLTIEISGPQGETVYTGEIPASGHRIKHSIQLETVAPWSPDSPSLYSISITLFAGGTATDSRKDKFGFRRFEAKDGFLHLNGTPLYLRAALDQDYYPDGFGAPPSLELLEDQLGKAKAMGLNCLRCHIKVPDPRYYEVADRLGMLIWTEIPNIETFTPASAERLRRTMEGILARDRNHPSIVIWTLINEDWGTRLHEAAEQRQWISDMVDWLRAEDPLRLVIDNSACFPNVHVKTDINDYHFYRTAVDRREEWERLCREFAGNADWTFSTDKEAVRTRKEPLILSEFGVWGLPDPARLRREDGGDPWWMAYGATWADGTALPQGLEARFRELGLGQIFGDLGRFIEQVQWYQYMNLKYEIEVIRTHVPIGGYVITEFTDVHWEGNGLMDMARNPRVFAEALPAVNSDVVIAPGAARHAIYEEGTAHFDIKISSGGKALPEGTRLLWEFGAENGAIELPAIAPMQVHNAEISAAASKVPAPEVQKAGFRIVAPDGTILSRNSEAIAVYGRRGALAPIRFAADDDGLSERLSALGHVMVSPNEADVFVTGDIDAARVEAIHSGQRVLQILAKDPGRLRDDTPPRDGPMSIEIDAGGGGMLSGPYFSFPGYGLVNRHKSIWRGDWVGNFSWLRRDGVFAHIPGGPLFDMSFTGVVPHQLMTGFRPWEFQGRVHAGVVVGWVHKPAAFIIEKRLGRGKLVATTFRLNQEAPDIDPLATALYDGLLTLAARP